MQPHALSAHGDRAAKRSALATCATPLARRRCSTHSDPGTFLYNARESKCSEAPWQQTEGRYFIPCISEKRVEVRGSRFVLEDSSKKEWIVMELEKGAPVVKLFGSTGQQPQVVLSVDEGKRARIALASPYGNPVILLTVLECPQPTGSALVNLLGDYAGDVRKEIRITNCGTNLQPEVTLEVDGVVVAKLP